MRKIGRRIVWVVLIMALAYIVAVVFARLGGHLGARLPGGVIICLDGPTCMHELCHDVRIRALGWLGELRWYLRYLTDKRFRTWEEITCPLASPPPLKLHLGKELWAWR